MIKKLLQTLFPYNNDSAALPLKQKNLRNAGWNVVDFLVFPLFWLFYTPVFIRYLGAGHYGIWMLVNSFLGFSGVFGFGFTDALVKYVSKSRASQENERIVLIVRTVLTATVLIGVLILIIIHESALFLASRVFRVQPADIPLVMSSITLGGVGIFLRMIDEIIISIFHGYERYDLASKLNLPVTIVVILVNLLLVISGYDVPAVLLSTLVFIMFGIVIKALFVKYLLLREMTFLPCISSDIFRELLNFSFYCWVRNVSGIILGQADKLILTSFLGTTALTYYTVCLQLTQQVHVLISKAFAFVFPLVVQARESSRADRLRQIYFKGLNLTSVAAIAMGLPLFVFAEDILTLWMGNPFAILAAPTLKILVVVFTLLATSIVPYYFMNGTEFYRLNTMTGLAGGAIVIISSFGLIPTFGIVGAALARLTILPASIVARTVIHYRVLNDRRWYAALVVFLPIVAIYCIAHFVVILNPLSGRLNTAMLFSSIVIVAFTGGISLYALMKRINPVL